MANSLCQVGPSRSTAPRFKAREIVEPLPTPHFTFNFCPLLALGQLLVVIGDAKHSAFRVRIGDGVSDRARFFGALTPMLRIVYRDLAVE